MSEFAEISKEEFELLKRQFAELLPTLTEREKNVIIMRFGLNGEKPRTLEEVAKEFNVARERIRQIECKALRKVTLPSRREQRNSFIE